MIQTLFVVIVASVVLTDSFPKELSYREGGSVPFLSIFVRHLAAREPTRAGRKGSSTIRGVSLA